MHHVRYGYTIVGNCKENVQQWRMMSAESDVNTKFMW